MLLWKKECNLLYTQLTENNTLSKILKFKISDEATSVYFQIKAFARIQRYLYLTDQEVKTM